MGWGIDRSAVVGECVVQDTEEEEGDEEVGKEVEGEEDERNAEDGSDNDATSKGDGESDAVVDVDVRKGEYPGWRVC